MGFRCNEKYNEDQYMVALLESQSYDNESVKS